MLPFFPVNKDVCEVASNPITRQKTIKTKKQRREEEKDEEEESKSRRSTRTKKSPLVYPKAGQCISRTCNRYIATLDSREVTAA